MADIQFWRSNQFSETSFLDLVKRTFGKTFTNGIDAKNWLITNGYYTSYPDIVTDGLVLNLDASNLDSFKGEPTTNLHSVYSSGISPTLVGTSPISAACGSGGWSWCAYGGAYTFNYFRIRNPYGLVSDVGNLQNTVTGGDYRMEIADIGATTLNRTFTFSVWIKNNGGSVTSLQISLATNGDSNGAGQIFSITNDWQRLVYTRTFTGTCTNNVRTYFFGLGVGTNVLLYGAQLEEKDHVTPFIDGTRGTTYATNGGWCDLSGNGNHAELSGNVLYNSSNNGTLVLDGASGFINNSSITTSTTCTVIIFYKTTDTTELWVRGNNDGNFYLCAADGAGAYYHNNVGTPINYVDLNVVTVPSSYRNGNYHMFEAKNVNFSSWTSFQWFLYGGSWDLVGSVSQILVYNRNLTSQESQQIFNTYKERFGL